MARDMLQETLGELRTFIQAQGWQVVEDKEIPYGWQLHVSDGKNRTSIAVFKTGKVLIQGKATQLQNDLQMWDTKRRGSGGTKNTTPVDAAPILFATSTSQTNVITAHIGSDESGKGDYYGPLVVAAVYIDEKTGSRLAELGVRDSKTIRDQRIIELAQEIKKLCRGMGTVLTYMPEEYNKRYQEAGNLNVLLARAHIQVLKKVATTAACDRALVDQFAHPALLDEVARQAGLNIHIEQRTRAEEDMAVAAASIVARAEFVQRCAALARQMGVELPKGASDPRIIEVGRQILAREGEQGLKKVAKWHFQTTAAIVENG